MPALNTGTAEIMIFIYDDEDKNEETFCVKVNYISENDEDWECFLMKYAVKIGLSSCVSAHVVKEFTERCRNSKCYETVIGTLSKRS